ncbi:MAG: glycosyltransferase family 2 protein [Myxococcota bacterium]
MVRLAVVVPAYNEEGALRGAIEDLRRHVPDARVIVVNDASTDATPEVARAIEGVEVLDLPARVGTGGAVREGLRRALATDADAVVQFDADGQHRGDQVAMLLATLGPEVDVVVGSRFLGGAGYRPPPLRRLGIEVLNASVRGLGGPVVTDATSGFRALSRRAAARLADRDDPEPVALLLLARAGLRVVEAPVRMEARAAGRSSLEGLAAVSYMMRVLGLLVRVRLS